MAILILEARYGWNKNIWAPSTCSHADGCKDVTSIVQGMVNGDRLHINPSKAGQYMNRTFWPETARGPAIPRKIAVKYRINGGPIKIAESACVPNETADLLITASSAAPSSPAAPTPTLLTTSNLVLVPTGDARALNFKPHPSNSLCSKNTPLYARRTDGSLAAISSKFAPPRNAWSQWDYIDLGVGSPKPDHRPLRVTYDGSIVSYTDHAYGGEFVFDVSMWKMEENNHLVLCKGVGIRANNTRNWEDMKGRRFTLNNDGTLSPSTCRKFVLGAALPPPGGFLAKFRLGGITGYNARFNGDYVASGQQKNDFPVYTHLPTEGVGAHQDWCRCWWHGGAWRIGHVSWVGRDPTRCCAVFYPRSKNNPHDQDGEWLQHRGEGSNKDHGQTTEGKKGHFKPMNVASYDSLEVSGDEKEGFVDESVFFGGTECLPVEFGRSNSIPIAEATVVGAVSVLSVEEHEKKPASEEDEKKPASGVMFNFCPECGFKVAMKGAKFCSSCGCSFAKYA